MQIMRQPSSNCCSASVWKALLVTFLPGRFFEGLVGTDHNTSKKLTSTPENQHTVSIIKVKMEKRLTKPKNSQAKPKAGERENQPKQTTRTKPKTTKTTTKPTIKPPKHQKKLKLPPLGTKKTRNHQNHHKTTKTPTSTWDLPQVLCLLSGATRTARACGDLLALAMAVGEAQQNGGNLFFCVWWEFFEVFVSFWVFVDFCFIQLMTFF